MTRSRAQKLDHHASLPAAPAQKAAAAISASKMLPLLAEGDEEAAREAEEGKPNAAASPVAAAAACQCTVGICGGAIKAEQPLSCTCFRMSSQQKHTLGYL